MGRACAVALVVSAFAVAVGACGRPAAPEAPAVELVIGRSPPGDAAAPSATGFLPSPSSAEDQLAEEEPYGSPPLPGANVSPFSGTCPPFDRGAAAQALGSINVSSCKRAGGPDGNGHVKITYATSGQVQAAVIDGGPFPGTPVGGCIASLFRNAAVPPFCGASVTVGKSFTLR